MNPNLKSGAAIQAGNEIKCTDTALGLHARGQRERFNASIEKIFADCFALIKTKNEDYTKLNENDPFYNFQQDEIALYVRNNNLNVDPLVLGLLIRINDKRRRISNLILTASDPKVVTETLEDSIKDIINYYTIMLSYQLENGYLKHRIDYKIVTEDLQKEISYLRDEINLKNEALATTVRHSYPLTTFDAPAPSNAPSNTKLPAPSKHSIKK